MQQVLVPLTDKVIHEFNLERVNTTRITFMIPFRGVDRLPHLAACCKNINTRYPDCEILIIEDGITRVIKTPIIGTRYVFMYNRGPFNKAKCFNLGFLCATHNIICGLDCDMLVPSTIIDRTIEHVNSNKVVFPGREIYYVDSWDPEKSFTQEVWNQETWSENRTTSQFHGGIFLCNKIAYARVGGFDHRFEGYGSEDTNFYTRCTETGGEADTTRVIDMIHINHPHDNTDMQLIERNRRLLTIYSNINPRDRITDCKRYNIFCKT